MFGFINKNPDAITEYYEILKDNTNNILFIIYIIYNCYFVRPYAAMHDCIVVI